MTEPGANRNPLPPGTASIGVSLVVAGATSYGFLVISARALGSAEYAPLSALWALVILVGPGMFLPLEQEVTRALAARRVLGVGGRPLVRRATILGVGLLGLLVLTTPLTGPLLTDHLFDGNSALTLGLVLALSGFCAAHLTKGVLSGAGRFRGYARYTGVESAARFGLCAVLALIGVTSAGPYGLMVGIAPAIGVAAALFGEKELLLPGPPAPWSEIWPALGALLAGSLLSFGLVNVGPLSVKLLATDAEADQAGRFLVALVVARIPLFLFQAVQAALLPRLSELATEGDLEGLRRGLGRLLAWLSGLGVIGAVGAAAVGPTAVRILFGDEYRIGARTMAMLAASSGTYMVATAVAQANIALSAHVRTAWAWGVGVAVFAVLVLTASDDLFLRVEVASVVGCGAALIAQLVVLAQRSRAHVPIEHGDAVEAVVDRPPLP
jgi:O-antigen/teichoic acid export membrane protein